MLQQKPRLVARRIVAHSLSLLLFAQLCGTARAQQPPAQSEAEKLAAALAASKTDEEREARLSEKRELEGVELRRALVREAERRRVQAQHDEALAILRFTRRLAERTGDRAGVADVLRVTGINYAERGETARAMEHYQQSLKLSEEIGDNLLTARSLNSIGLSMLGEGKHESALEHFRRALAIGESSGDMAQTAWWLGNIGLVYRTLGDNKSALEYLRRSLAMHEAAQNNAGVALALRNIGLVHHDFGEYAQALESFQKSLSINEEAGNKLQMAGLSLNIGSVHLRQGDLGNALTYYQKALAIAEPAGLKYMTADSYVGLGLFHERKSDYTRALDFYRKSLPLAEASGSKNLIAHILSHIGGVYSLQGRYDEALEQYRASAALLESINAQGCLSGVRAEMAEAQYRRGDYARALSEAGEATKAAARSGLRENAWRALATTGKSLLALKQPAEARKAFDEAISVIESLRGDVAGGAHEHQRFFETKLAPYQLSISALLAENKMGEAFAYAERAKARVLLDALRRGRASVAKAMTATERERERQLKAELSALNSQAAAEHARQQRDAAKIEQLEARQRRARLDYEAFRAGLYAAHPELRTQRGEAQTLTLAEAAALIPDERAALLEYVLTDEGACLFVLTRSGAKGRAEVESRVYTLGAKAEELGERAENFRRALAGREPFAPAARELYDLLLRPAARQLKGRTTLVVVPDGGLWNLPFQALQSAPGRFLLEDAAISYAPSLTALAAIRNSPRREKTRTARADTLLAFGNPALSAETTRRAESALRGEPLGPLVAAEREVAALRDLYGPARSRVYTGAEAREDRLKSEAGRFGVVQLATHGVLDNSAPMYSHLLLAPAADGAGGATAGEDGLLEAWEMMNLDLDAELFVLSACETARGRIGAGEGVIGMSWALFVAGVPTTVVSQWKVSSEGTAELMLDFHRNLRGGAAAGEKASKAEALRRAALKLMRSGGAYRHPFYWAAFVVVGDGD